MAIISWNKKYTETLAVTVERFRHEYPEYKDVKVTYAGRLDPMAEGLLILLTGEDVHRKEEFLGWPKAYEVDFICGMETDTYDILGRISSVHETTPSKDDCEKNINSLLGTYQQPYPAYSSKTLNGTALWKHSREGTLDEHDRPTQEITVYESTFLRATTISLDALEQEIITNINKVSGDFRQAEIIQKWKDYFKTIPREDLVIYTAGFRVSSGTYIRALVSRVGQQLGSGAVSLKIRRTQVGERTLT